MTLNISLAVLFAMVLARFGFSFFTISALLLMVYFYPIITSDNIYIWDFDTLLIHEVDENARFLIVALAAFLLLANFIFKKPGSEVLECKKKVKARYGLMIMLSLYLLHLHEMSPYILKGIADKVLAMGYQSYASNISDAALLYFFALGMICRTQILIIVSLLCAIAEAFLGFRYVLTHQVVIYLLVCGTREYFGRYIINWKNAGMFIVVILVFVLKIFNYSLPSLSHLSKLSDNAIGENYAEYFNSNAFNPESTSTSVVFNEMVNKEFRIKSAYVEDVFISMVPFGNRLFEHKLLGFADYYKSELFGKDADSFPSGLLSLFYSISGVASFIGLTYLYYYACYKLYMVGVNKYATTIVRAVCFALVSILICYGLRSDIVYLFSLIRSLFFVAVIYYLLLGLTQISVKRFSDS